MRSLHRVRTAAWARGLLLTTTLSLPIGIGLSVAQSSAGASGLASATATYHGLGWDNCGLPTVSQLTAWTKANSPYKTVNVYIGGVNAACPQAPASSWVQSVTKLGMDLIPTYVGLQAPVNTSCPCAKISPTKAYSQGVAAAADAVKIMAAAGIGKGNPIYEDMEGYDRVKENVNSVRTYLKGWTVELHKLGYVSGVYVGESSGVKDLVAVYGTKYVEPDDIWIAYWDGARTVTDPSIPAADWANHQRLHQFQGGGKISAGGVTFSGVDLNFCDGAVVSAASLTGG